MLIPVGSRVLEATSHALRILEAVTESAWVVQFRAMFLPPLVVLGRQYSVWGHHEGLGHDYSGF
ncbi:MAG: hypothetical protein PHF56_01790 [Desulfuromonadaceae bacterium]|nr:hypothetical protein [Desulfuromonadaceae bacterium]